jgi:tetratricopeptide (TPR) repeat protein
VQVAIAGMLIAAGQFDEARETLARVEQIYRSNLPAGHRNLEFLAESQARLALETGDFAAAEATFERLRTVPGEEFALTRLSSSRYLAQLRMKQMRWSEAQALYEEIRNTRPEMYRPLDEYFDAALAYTAFRAAGAQPGGVDKEEVSQAIAAAMGSLQDQQLARTREFSRLENWARDLDSPS